MKYETVKQRYKKQFSRLPYSERIKTHLRRLLGGVSAGHDSTIVLKHSGYCLTCDHEVQFIARNTWLRDHFLCSRCGSIPRERALMYTLEKFYPQWRDLTIHESSPGHRGASLKLQQECKEYIPSQFFSELEPGILQQGMRSENLENMTFADKSIDLHITQDVIEHVFSPEKVFREIARTLKPGGAHVFTVPLVNKEKSSQVRAQLAPDGKINYLQPAIYHGNPISKQGSLVTFDWGYDLVQLIANVTSLPTLMLQIDDLSKGIRAEYIEVLVTFAPKEEN